MKKTAGIALALVCLMAVIPAYAAEAPQQDQAAIATAAHFAAAYPTAKEKLPPLPVPPASANDVKAATAYIAAVDAYLKAAQSYIDASANDVNFIIKERNEAIESANQVLANYNAFFKLDEKK